LSLGRKKYYQAFLTSEEKKTFSSQYGPHKKIHTNPVLAFVSRVTTVCPRRIDPFYLQYCRTVCSHYKNGEDFMDIQFVKEFFTNRIYWVTQKLPQICNVILRTGIEKVA